MTVLCHSKQPEYLSRNPGKCAKLWIWKLSRNLRDLEDKLWKIREHILL